MPFTTALSVVEGIFVWKNRTKKIGLSVRFFDMSKKDMSKK